MPQRDDYAMLCYGFYKEFNNDDKAHQWTNKILKFLNDNICKNEEFCGDDCYGACYMWQVQFTTDREERCRVYIYMNNTDYSVGSRCGTFNTQISFDHYIDLPKFISINKNKYICSWHLVMWGPHFHQQRQKKQRNNKSQLSAKEVEKKLPEESGVQDTSVYFQNRLESLNTMRKNQIDP